MRPILERLKEGEILVGDGAMGTMLFNKGLKAGDCPEILNLSKPDIIEKIARQYLLAGADIIQTNTFGASSLKLSDYQIESKTIQINKAAVDLVKNIVDNKAYISGTCGPSGKLLKPYGEIEEEIMFGNYKDQLTTLVNAGVDIICIETMTDLREAVLAIKAAKSVNAGIPILSTMTFDKIPKGYFTIMGISIEDAVEGLIEAGADIIGSNCGNGIDNMIEIATLTRKLTDKPIIIQSNAGIPDQTDDGLIYPETPSYFYDKTLELIDAGVSIIGGCCGTTPEHIRSIKKAINSRSFKY